MLDGLQLGIGYRRHASNGAVRFELTTFGFKDRRATLAPRPNKRNVRESNPRTPFDAATGFQPGTLPLGQHSMAEGTGFQPVQAFAHLASGFEPGPLALGQPSMAEDEGLQPPLRQLP